MPGSRITPLLLFPFLVTITPAVGADGGTVAGKVKYSQEDQARHTVVYLDGKGLDRSPKPAPEKPPQLVQDGKAFAPDFLVVLKGATVDFPNKDRVFHNVFSLKPGFQFDLGLYKKGDSKSFTFNHAGVTDVYCNIHPDMFATVVVVPNPYYAEPDQAGNFKIEGVPPGEYDVVAQTSLCTPAKTHVTVPAGGDISVTLNIPPRSRSRSHKKKDGSDYGRYKE